MNLSIPHQEWLLREEYLYDLSADHAGGYLECLVFGAASLSGRALGFHALLRNGAQFGRLPVSAFCTRPCEPVALSWLQVWDCFSYRCEATEYEWLEGARCEVFLKDQSWQPGSYVLTFDWYGSEAAEAAGDTGWKCAHLVELDSGHIVLQPNNRMRWHDASFVTEEFPARPDYKTMSKTFKCEDGTKWANEDRYFYGVS